MTEVWRDIPSYEDRYQVSNLGRIRSIARTENYGRWRNGGKRKIKGRIRKLSWAGSKKSQYLGCFVKNNSGKGVFLKAHICVLLAFVGPRPDGFDGCHCDGDRSNNELTNLRWDTKSANNLDKHKHGTAQTGSRNGSSRLTEEQVREIRSRSGQTLKSLSEEFGISITTMSKIRRGELWKYIN